MKRYYLGLKRNKLLTSIYPLEGSVSIGCSPENDITLVDYNVCDPQRSGGKSHLELRTPLGKLNYTNVMPDLNGRRYMNYVLAARLSELAGRPGSDLLERSSRLRRRPV